MREARSREVDLVLISSNAFLDRGGLMSGDATGIICGDEQDWKGGSVGKSVGEAIGLGFEILPQSSERTCSYTLGQTIVF